MTGLFFLGKKDSLKRKDSGQWTVDSGQWEGREKAV